MSQWARSKHDWQLTKCSIKDRFQELLRLSQWTDCTFSVGEDNVEVICCHKLVLAASSPVFEALFYGGLSELKEVIRVPDVEPYVFRLFLNYIYSDSLDLQNIDEAGGLLYVSKKYIMPQLSEICLSYLIENTTICTLWDVLAIAEALNEEELMAICLKVMSRYSYKIWSTSSDDHLSRNTLLRLLDLRQMNMKDVDLFKYLLDWAAKECSIEEVSPSPQNLRSCLKSFGALEKIRFLTFTPREFSEVVVSSGILTKEECNVFESLIGGEMVEQLELEIVRTGFSSDAEPRSSIAPLIWRCTREIARGDRFWIYIGPVQVGITSSSRVLVTGFEIVTRISTMGVPKVWPHSGYTYRERLVAFVKDQSDNILCKTDHDENVEFNSHQIVTLSYPVWFEPGIKYIVHFDFPSGQYPLSHYAETALAKGTTFRFDDMLQREDHCKGSFIHSILYSY
uniref:BTB/POZ domain-containing protein 6 n=1 Tax=Lygus hesperus TaxID=30085 RepID=A0A146KNV7_LYGHE